MAYTIEEGVEDFRKLYPEASQEELEKLAWERHVAERASYQFEKDFEESRGK